MLHLLEARGGRLFERAKARLHDQETIFRLGVTPSQFAVLAPDFLELDPQEIEPTFHEFTFGGQPGEDRICEVATLVLSKRNIPAPDLLQIRLNAIDAFVEGQ
jgi:hypothetical protein